MRRVAVDPPEPTPQHHDSRKGTTHDGDERHRTASIQPRELSGRIDDATTTIVDVRPLPAYNGWRLNDEARGGHIPGATSFPAAWLGRVDDAEIRRDLDDKGITPDRSIVLYGDDAAQARAVADGLARFGLTGITVLEGGFPAWAADDSPADRGAPALRPPRLHRVAARPARGRATGGLRQRQVPAAPRQLRGARGVRGEPSPRRALPRHQPSRGPGGLEPTLPRGDRGDARGARASRTTRRSCCTAATRSATRTRNGRVVVRARSRPPGRR